MTIQLPKFLILLSLLLLLSSCGERPIEGDKHPSLSIFPEHSNPKVIIKPFARLTTLASVGDYYYGFGQDLQGADKAEKNETLYLYDQQFNIINKMSSKDVDPSPTAEIFYKVEHHEKIYNDNIKEITQIFVPSFKRKIIRYTNFDKEITQLSKYRVEQKYQKQIKEGSKSSGFNKEELINSLYNKERLIYEGERESKVEELLEGLICAKEIDSFTYVLRYADREKIVMFVSLSEHLRYKMCADPKAIPESLADSFDKTVMGNTWAGVSILRKYTPHGYDYINLTIDNESTQTKVKNKDEKSGLSIIYNSPEKLIVKAGAEDYFIVTKNE